MDVQEVRHKVCQLQARIQVLCEEFQNETQLPISDLRGDFIIDTIGQRFPDPRIRVIIVI